jgi:hypothetical protein
MAGDATIVVAGVGELNLRLDTAARTIKDLSPAMKDSGDYLVNFFSGVVFASRGGAIGKPWPALNPRYAVWKAERYPGRPPLIRTGLMNRSFRRDYGALSAKIYNEAEYFKYHQQGLGVPERVMMAIDDERGSQIQSIFERFVAKALGTV